jgi:uncharacterized protein
VIAPDQGSGAEASVLAAPHILEFPYTRSTGPIIGAFLTGLRDGRIVGIRARDGRVLVPPQEFDPTTVEELTTDDLVDVSPVGTIASWSWNPQPRPGQPSDEPFAWVQVRLDGADTTLLHAVTGVEPGDLATGARVRIRWASERVGSIHDIAGFELTPDEAAGEVPAQDASDEDVTVVTTPMRLEYRYTPGKAASTFLRGTQERRLIGLRCSSCHKVYLPPRGACSMCGADFSEEVEVAQSATVATFAIVNVNFASREVDLPYAAVEVRFDGADTTAQFLIQGVTTDQVRMGMRVRAVWREGELEPTLSNVTHVEPIDEPDAPFETYAEFV